MANLLQRLPFLLELFFNGSFIFLYSLKISKAAPALLGPAQIESLLAFGVLVVPVFVGIQTVSYYLRSQGAEDFIRKYIFSIIVFVPLVITWGDLDFAYWLSSAHLIASIMALYDADEKKNPFEERIEQRNSWLRFFKFSPAQIVVGSFVTVILVGTFLLMLPIASTSEQSLSFYDALFMATSATCVTGLATLTVSTDLTLFGQLVILLLIQIGGLSIMTLYSTLILVLGRSLQMRDQVMMQDLLELNSLDDLFNLLINIVRYTFIIQLWGVLVLTIGFTFEGFEFGQALWYGLFHSISAFCNAGISLFPNSMESFSTSPIIHLTVGVLSTLGGLGFIVLREIQEIISGRRSIGRLSLHSRIVLSVSGTLVLGGATLFFFAEFLHVLDGYALNQKLQISLFQSMMRTAGFNSIPFDSLKPYTIYAFTLFMFIGGSPGSTAGGLKTTTLAILLYTIRSTLKGAKDVVIYDRRIPQLLVVKVIAITFLSIILISFVLLVIVGIEENMSFISLYFEVISAFATVGLSLGITPDLQPISKLILAVAMLTGRIGPITLIIAVSLRSMSGRGKIDYPDARVMIG
jgi:trk system potassium uptake protein